MYELLFQVIVYGSFTVGNLMCKFEELNSGDQRPRAGERQ